MINWNREYRKSLKTKDRELYLTLVWLILNRTCFQGAIPGVPRFFMISSGPFLGAYQALVKRGKVKSSALLINEDIFSLSTSKFKEVMLHEMAHQYCFEVLSFPHRHHPNLWKKVFKEALDRL